jgi:nitric oxide reductase subunit B
VAHLALGATFSAMEVIPLLLLTLEGWSFIKAGEQKTLERNHLHRWAVWFLARIIHGF